MRTESFDHKPKLGLARGRRDVAQRPRTLEPTAVDAALADESLPMVAEAGSRRDAAMGPAAWGRPVRAGALSDAAMLESLADQLDMLHEQQRQIRRLLDRAGRMRVDAANS